MRLRVPNPISYKHGLGLSKREPMQEILTIADAAKELRCSKAHLAKVLNGQVPGLPHLSHLPLGLRKLIRRSVLYRWIGEVERAQSGMLSALPEVRAV
jgi:hypothetical protein